MTGRISKEELYLRMAEVAASRSACERHQVGAVITDSLLRNVLAVGYNGPAKGLRNACPGSPGSPGACGCVHAEVNALIKAPMDEGRVLFVTLSPCLACAQLLLNAGVSRVVYREAYRLPVGAALLVDHGVKVEQLRR